MKLICIVLVIALGAAAVFMMFYHIWISEWSLEIKCWVTGGILFLVSLSIYLDMVENEKQKKIKIKIKEEFFDEYNS